MSNDREFEFVLNQMMFGENGRIMNVAAIKKARDEASAEILKILERLELVTGMVVSSVDVEFDIDGEVRNTGVTSAAVRLDLE